MNVEFINPFLSSLINVLETMAQITLEPRPPALKRDDRAVGDISGLIGMVGPQTTGSFSITFEEELAFAIMAGMLGERPTELNDEVTDMVGEITNMVTGGAKKLLAEKGYEFEMATPMVVSGKGHTIAHQSKGPRIMIPLVATDGKAVMEICFEEACMSAGGKGDCKNCAPEVLCPSRDEETAESAESDPSAAAEDTAPSETVG